MDKIESEVGAMAASGRGSRGVWVVDREAVAHLFEVNADGVIVRAVNQFDEGWQESELSDALREMDGCITDGGLL